MIMIYFRNSWTRSNVSSPLYKYDTKLNDKMRLANI